MQIYNSYRIGLTSIYAVISLNNLLALLISQRDLLSQSSVKVDDIDTGISSGDSSVTDFAIDICMKLVSVEGELFVKQGPLKIPYGMKYHGFGERLAITPLTERFYFSLNKAFADLTVPIVRSGSGSVGVHTIRNLAFNLGFDAMFIDCHQTFTTSTRIYDHLKALVSTGVWMNFYNYESLSDVIDSTNQTASNLLSVLLSSLSTYRTCMANRSRKFSIGSTTFDVVNPGVLLPRVCLLSKGIKSTDIFIPSAMKQIFRPVKRMQPSRVVMIRVTLEANGLENGFVLAKKLVAFCIYLENNTGIDEETSSAYLIQNIRQIGKSNEFNGLPGYTQLELLIKRLVAMLPLDWRSKIREGDLRYICNLFLDISYSSEIDLKDFLPPYAIIDAEEKLYHYFNPSPQSTASVGNESFSLLVVGDVEVGKSVTIRRIAEKACNDYNAIIDRDIKSGSIKAFQIVTSPKKIYHDKMINPCVSADYEAFVDTAEEFLECLGHTSSLMSAAKNELFSILSVIDKQGPIMIIHLDVQSSLQVSELLVYANTYIEKHSIRAQLVWETTELDHIDPHIAVAFPIVYLQDKIYDLEAIIVERAEVMSIR